MLVSYLGPDVVTTSAEIFDGIRMKRDTVPFSNRSSAKQKSETVMRPKAAEEQVSSTEIYLGSTT